MTFSCGTPSCLIRPMQERPAAPAPLTTTLMSSSWRPVSSQALSKPAAAMIAVPCWSSWNTGMSSSSRKRLSMMKHSGLLMSSRLMPPNVGPMLRTVVMNSSTSCVVTSMSIESTSAKRLNRTHLPSITGFEAIAPRLPSPRIAVPFEITATRLPLDGVIVGVVGILGDRLHRNGHARRIGQRQIALRRHRLGRRDGDLAGGWAGGGRPAPRRR